MTSRLVLTIALVAPFVTALACGRGHGTGRQNTPLTDLRPCTEDSHAGWQAYWPELKYDFDMTRGCPYVVDSAGSPIPFEMRFDVEPSQYPQQWRWVSFAIWNNQGTLKRIGNHFPFQLVDLYGRLRARVVSTWPGGTGTGPDYQDSTLFTVDGGGHSPNFPWVRTKAPGRIRAYPPQITGQTYVVSGYPQGWQVDVSDELSAYRFQWYVNGSLVADATSSGLVHTLGEGPNTISVHVLMSDEVTHILNLSVTAVNCGGPEIC